jgi:hypothetical protein
MEEPLAFKSMEFSGCESVEVTGPTSYTVRRKASENLVLKAELNKENKEQQRHWSLEYFVVGSEYKSFWTPLCWNHLVCPPGDSDAYISVCIKRPVPGEASFSISVKVITAELSAEERTACTHPSTMTSEGQCWGGGSGSCTVEMVTSCAVCGATLSTYHDHRD